MSSVTVEYVLLIPLLLTQVIVFPFVASTITSNWQNSQREIELQDAANHLASTIQQLYLTVNRNEILTGIVTQAFILPPTVGTYPYTATGSLSDPLDGSTKVLTISLTLDELDNSVTALAVLGPNVQWTNSSLRSTSNSANIVVQKFSNSTLNFSFGG